MAQEQKPRERPFITFMSEVVLGWRPNRKQWLWVVRIVIMLVALLGFLTLIGSPFGITLWDWAQLLIIPAVLASGGIFFNQSQQERDRQSADRRAQDDALEAYLDDMTDLMINHHLRSPPQGEDEDSEDVRDVARARTLTVLARLDGARKAHVVQFLFDSGLIHKGKPAVDLRGADLREADLRTVFLSGANLLNSS